MATKDVGMYPKVMTVNDVAAYLRVHRTTVYRLLKNGQIPAFRVGSDWRFTTEAIDRWQNGLTVAQ
jgi:excisionase family DNA binding protein